VRNAFADELLALAAVDPRIVLLSGDIGNHLFDRFKERFPSRFFNCGVAEANMIGVAAGMAMSGLRPVVYTIASFATVRCLEQIRVDLCYHRQPVVLVGVGSGLSYASLGPTHHACEDIGMLRVLPGMAVVCPGDPFEVRAGLRAALDVSTPVYLRLGKKGEPCVHSGVPNLVLGRAIALRPGSDVALLASGTVLPMAVAAAAELERRGVDVALYSFPSVKPLDEECLADVFSTCRLIVTLEEHSVVGGVGGAVAEWAMAQPSLGARLLRVGTPDAFLEGVGSTAHARLRVGLTVDVLVDRVGVALEKGAAS